MLLSKISVVSMAVLASASAYAGEFRVVNDGIYYTTDKGPTYYTRGSDGEIIPKVVEWIKYRAKDPKHQYVAEFLKTSQAIHASEQGKAEETRSWLADRNIEIINAKTGYHLMDKSNLEFSATTVRYLDIRFRTLCTDVPSNKRQSFLVDIAADLGKLKKPFDLDNAYYTSRLDDVDGDDALIVALKISTPQTPDFAQKDRTYVQVESFSVAVRNAIDASCSKARAEVAKEKEAAEREAEEKARIQEENQKLDDAVDEIGTREEGLSGDRAI